MKTKLPSSPPNLSPTAAVLTVVLAAVRTSAGKNNIGFQFFSIFPARTLTACQFQLLFSQFQPPPEFLRRLWSPGKCHGRRKSTVGKLHHHQTIVGHSSAAETNLHHR
ncbi:hypothetical protein PIB30_051563 [Stylosanthes scabra]|uniref:Secreted protein n=1 Tax=Stylosanthes scabra TaxID=79078 RepID=A0ABU6QIS3_9FABA|nr:hypothetical protein [Stylosanthes scabra]